MGDCKPKVLIVDDVPQNIHILMEVIKDECRVIAATSGRKAIELALSKPHPDMIILDVMMPEMDGYQVLEELRKHHETRYIPVIFVSALADDVDEERALQLGAVDYITKPISPNLVKMRVRNQLELQRHRNHLEDLVRERTRDLELIRAVTLESMATIAEFRDSDTGGHIKRTQNYVKTLALELQRKGLYPEFLTDANIELLYYSAPLHDIGKVAIPDTILLKTGRLSQDEFDKMKEHADYGREALSEVEKRLPADSFISVARDIAAAHHERWDGTGYPLGLSGENIPLAGRLMAVADVYDALISRRPYKEALSHQEAVEIIMSGRGTQFDPQIADTFADIHERFANIALMYTACETEIASIVNQKQAASHCFLKKVLVVDDDEMYAKLTCHLLRSVGCEYDVAYDGRHGLEILRQKDFDLILCDLNMPVMDGITFVTTLRKKEKWKHIPVIALTGMEFGMNEDQALKYGFSGFLLKPLSSGIITSKLSALFHEVTATAQ